MGKNLVRQEFTNDASWTAPGGVNRVKVKATTYVFKQISGSDNTSPECFAIDAAGNAFAWGLNSSGALGLGDTTPRSSPVLVLGGFRWQQIVGGSTYGLGYDVFGNAYAWGNNGNGNLGIGSVTAQSSPVAVLGGFKFRQLAALGRGSYGIASTGAAYAWGLNANGQLGLGDVTARSSPVIILGSLKWQRITAGQSHAAGLVGGIAYTWGLNANGQLGNGDVVPRSSPVAVVGPYRWAAIAAGDNTTLGITTAGQMYAWGVNSNFQLGNGTSTPASSPTLVSGGLKWRAVAAGLNQSAGIDSEGVLYTWGANATGALGTGNTTAASIPTAVTAPSNVAFLQVAIGTNMMVALGSDLNLYAWGSNASGQLGQGDVVAKSSPVLVLGGLTYPGVFQTQINEVEVDVIPGNAYNVYVFGALASFNRSVGVYQDVFGGGSQPVRITLEYEA